MDEVDFTILAATSVLGDLIEKCPPAEACRDAFERMSKATIQMCLATTGFGAQAEAAMRTHSQSTAYGRNQASTHGQLQARRPPQQALIRESQPVDPGNPLD